jgi:hypothetical protein
LFRQCYNHHACTAADCRNAINTISRSSIKQALLDNCPLRVPFVLFEFSQPSKVFFKGMAQGEHLDLATSMKQRGPTTTNFLITIIQAVNLPQTQTLKHTSCHLSKMRKAWIPHNRWTAERSDVQWSG